MSRVTELIAQKPYYCNIMDLKRYWKISAIASLTLGLAPFQPEPHIWGKLKWILGGAKGMRAMDWLDTAFHGVPWVILIILTMVLLLKKN